MDNITEKPSFESVYLLTQRNAEAIQKLGERLDEMARREEQRAQREEERRIAEAAAAAKREQERKAEEAKREQERKAEQAKREAEAAKREEERKAEEAKREEERKAEEAKREQERKAEEAKREQERKAEEAKREQERKAEQAKREQERKAEEAKREQERKAEQAKREQERKAEEAKRKQERKAERDELAKTLRDSRRRINKLDELFTSQWGKLVEALVDGQMVQILNERGIEVGQTNQRSVGYYQGKKQEIDILAINGDEIVAIEVKTTLRPEDIKVFEDKLKVLKLWMRRYADAKVYGAVACIRADGGSAELAAKRGLFVIRAVGSSAYLTNDEDFKPRTF